MCIRDGSEMEPIKNGFHFMDPKGSVRSGDLWGCPVCFRFQLHGVPNGQAHWNPLFGYVHGDEVIDPGNEMFTAYLDPEIEFTGAFWAHLKEWYPGFYEEWKVIEDYRGYWKKEGIGGNG